MLMHETKSKEKSDMFSKPSMLGIIDRESSTLTELRLNAGNKSMGHIRTSQVLKAGVI